MPSDSELAELEKVASVIYIIGSIIAIISANITQQMDAQKQAEGRNSTAPPTSSTPTATHTTPTHTPTPTQLAVIISWIFTIGNFLFGQVAYERLKKVEAAVKAGTEQGSAIPNVYIVIGWILGIVGAISRVIGAKLREEQQRPMTIL